MQRFLCGQHGCIDMQTDLSLHWAHMSEDIAADLQCKQLMKTVLHLTSHLFQQYFSLTIVVYSSPKEVSQNRHKAQMHYWKN